MFVSYKIIISFVIFAFFTWCFFAFPDRKKEDEKIFNEKIEKMMKEFNLTENVTDNFEFQSAELSTIKNCYLQKLNELIQNPNSNTTLDWLEIGTLPKKCANSLNTKLSKFIPTPKHYEIKHFIAPKINDSCAIVTFGIGHEIENELFLKKNYPQCSFLGIDPDPIINEPMFIQKLSGHFVKAAVGGKTQKGAITRIDTLELKFRFEKAQKLSVSSLLENYHGKDRPIDLVNFDIEGTEFEVFEMMPDEKIYNQICQFNVEFHHPEAVKADYSTAKAIKIIQKVINDGTFVWVKNDVLLDVFYPSYFINVKNQYCFKKYLEGRIDA